MIQEEQKLIEEIKNIIRVRDELLDEVYDAHEFLDQIGVEGGKLSLIDRIKLMIKKGD